MAGSDALSIRGSDMLPGHRRGPARASARPGNISCDRASISGGLQGRFRGLGRGRRVDSVWGYCWLHRPRLQQQSGVSRSIFTGQVIDSVIG